MNENKMNQYTLVLTKLNLKKNMLSSIALYIEEANLLKKKTIDYNDREQDQSCPT